MSKMENCKVGNIPEKRFLQKLLELGSNHYARNNYIKVSLKIAVPWILLTSKILYQKTLANLFEDIEADDRRSSLYSL